MKKIALLLWIGFSLVLSACGSSATATTAGVTATAKSAVVSTASNSVRLDASYENAATVEIQLLIGTFKLEGTDLAVTADQAKVLLPLWQQIQTLSQSVMPGPGNAGQGQTEATPTAQTDSAEIQTQIDGVLEQVQAAMTAGQIQAIADMKITQESATAAIQELGISMGGPGGGQQPPSGDGQQPPSGDGQQPPSGDGQQPPSGDGQQPQGTPPADMQAPEGTPPADGQGRQGGGMMEMMLVNAMVDLLQTRSGGTTAQADATSAAPAGDSSSTGGSAALSGAYVLDGGTDSQTGQTYTADGTDQSAIYVYNSGRLTLVNAIVVTTGNTSSNDNSSFYGLNAAVLAAGGGVIDMSDSQVTTSGSGANGVFSTGANSLLTFARGKITATGNGGHAAMATQGGTMVLTDVDMDTSGASASAIATDRGGGTITVTGGTVHTSGMNSAGIYSTGNITVTGTVFVSDGAEAAVIEGANSITLTDASMTANKAGKWGVMIYQSMSGDAEGNRGTFTMTGGSLACTATDGPLFYVTNTTAVIVLRGVSLNAASGVLVNAAAGNWGNSGSNGGTVLLTADGQVLRGDLIADAISSITLTMQNASTLEGAIDPLHTAKAANLSLDGSSTWTVTADSYLTTLTVAGGISGDTVNGIIGNGHTVYYDATQAANSWLGGKTYNLSGGGTLTPM